MSKADARVEAYGSVDELNSVLGLVRSGGFTRELLEVIQRQLFEIGGELAADPEKVDKLTLPKVDEAAIKALEDEIDWCETQLEPLKHFVLPGGTVAASQLHLARTVCRRAERRVVAVGEDEPVREELVRFLNRLSDLLFCWARWTNRRAEIPDVLWIPREG